MNLRSVVAVVFLLVSGLPVAATASPIIIFSENFDAISDPALPAGWTSTDSPSWTTSTTSPFSSPNDAFVPDVSTLSDTSLISPSISLIGVTNAVLSFQNNYVFERDGFNNFFDGGVLEISINGGGFVDAMFFGPLNYNSTIASSSGNPLGGRLAWGGNSGGYILSSISLSSAVDDQTIQLRWRLGTDDSVGAAGWRIDDVVLTGDVTSLSEVPEPATITLLGIGLLGVAAGRRRRK